MKTRLTITAMVLICALLLAACGEKLPHSPAEPGTSALSAPEGPRHALSFTSDGETVSLMAADVPDFSAAAFVKSDADEALEKATPAVKGLIKYQYDGALYDFSFDEGAMPIYELYWFFQNGALAAFGPAGVTPEEAGDYLVYIDFLFADGGAVSARRAAVWMEMSHADKTEFDALAASGVPRGFSPEVPPLSESYRAYLESQDDTVFETGTADPEEALRQWILLQSADELASGDPFYKLDDVRVWDVSLRAQSYLDGFGVSVVAYQSAVKPSSPEYHMLQHPMDTNIHGTGEWEGWLLAEGIAFLRFYGDGVWCCFDHVWGVTDFPSEMGFSAVSEGKGPEKTYPPAEFLAGDTAEFIRQPWFLLENPEKIDWDWAKAEYGPAYCHNLLALVRANAFNSLPNRTAAYGGILGEIRHFPQALRTAAVMLAANNVYLELADGYAGLLRELQTIDPEGFAYCLTQMTSIRAAEILAMTK